VAGEISNRRGGPIPSGVWDLFASADMDDVEDAMVAHGVARGTDRWASAKKHLRRVRNQYRARLCQSRVRTDLANALDENKKIVAALTHQRQRADRGEACLHAAPHAMPNAEWLRQLILNH
jgi:hypothetical protein